LQVYPGATVVPPPLVGGGGSGSGPGGVIGGGPGGVTGGGVVEPFSPKKVTTSTSKCLWQPLAVTPLLDDATEKSWVPAPIAYVAWIVVHEVVPTLVALSRLTPSILAETQGHHPEQDVARAITEKLVAELGNVTWPYTLVLPENLLAEPPLAPLTAILLTPVPPVMDSAWTLAIATGAAKLRYKK